MSKIIEIYPQGEGTYHPCEACPKEINCCVHAYNGSTIGSPFAFKHEIARIEEHTRAHRDTFLDPATEESEASGLAFIKTSEKGCYFYQNNQCTIYPARPFICALFPFDLEEIDGKLHWIFYTDLCLVPFDYTPQHFENAKQVLKNSGVSEAEFIKSLRSAPTIAASYMTLERAEFA